jgi:hypothetical protein
VTSLAARVGGGVGAGVVASAALALLAGAALREPARRDRLVPEDASGHLHRIAIHYVPALDSRALPVWRQLFRALPADVDVEVAVAAQPDFAHFTAELTAAGIDHLERFHAIVTGHALTTWSRDRMSALEDASGRGDGVLAPPRIATATGARAGDWDVPFAIARDVYRAQPRIAEYVFEGGDFAASRHFVFADANLIGRNLGRGDASRAHLADAVARTFAGDRLIWLGDAQGDVPEHHVMMYAVPLDDRTALVGDVQAGLALAGDAVAHDPDVATQIARFDRAADILEHEGFAVVRVPVVVLPGAGSYVTYTNALFDRDPDGARVVYLPTYRLPALDARATAIYRALGYRVVPVDVSTIYTLNGSLGCLVNVMDRVDL